jgi:acetylornithine deacetylase/succinyl-diaminopimelate desuccinylase-like protein
MNAQVKRKVLIYCPIDKRPQTTESYNGKPPDRPKIVGDWMYGRGTADAGYAIFAVLLAIKNL